MINVRGKKLLNELMGSSTKSEDALKEKGAEEDRGSYFWGNALVELHCIQLVCLLTA